MSHPEQFRGSSRPPQRLRRFVQGEEGMVAGDGRRPPPATIPSSTCEPLRGEQCGQKPPQ